MARYIDADALYKKIYPLDLADKRKYTINAKAVADAINNAPTADVVPRNEEGAECPICHGTGRIGTTDWLTKNISKKQLAEEKAKAIAEHEAEHERHIKTEVAREIFEEIDRYVIRGISVHGDNLTLFNGKNYAELKKKYTEGENSQ